VYYFLLIVLLLNGLLLSVVILLQSGKGGGLAAMGGGTSSDNLIGGRQAANLLTRTTWVSGGVFLFLSLVLSVMSSRQAGVDPVLRDEFQQAPVPMAPPVMPGTGTEPAPGVPGAAPTQPGTGPDGNE
jgi:preprotein translocase subunit SecG